MLREFDHHVRSSFDLSGLRTWHTKQSNIDRTNAIIKTFTSMFANMPNVVPVIAPLNE
jgi:glucan 1,3-beta-glucosidase